MRPHGIWSLLLSPWNLVPGFQAHCCFYPSAVHIELLLSRMFHSLCPLWTSIYAVPNSIFHTLPSSSSTPIYTLALSLDILSLRKPPSCCTRHFSLTGQSLPRYQLLRPLVRSMCRGHTRSNHFSISSTQQVLNAYLLHGRLVGGQMMKSSDCSRRESEMTHVLSKGLSKRCI